MASSDENSHNITRIFDELESESDVDDADADPDFIQTDHDSESEQSFESEDETELSREELEDREGGDSESVQESNYYRGRGRTKFKWSKQAPNTRVRVGAENIIRRIHLPGNIGPARELAINCSELDAWNCIFTNDMLDKTVLHTNEKLAEARSTYANYEDRYDLKDTDAVEMRALLGVLIYSAIFKSNHEDLNAMFACDGTGRDVFRASMSQKRALFLLSCLRFENKGDRQTREKIEKSAAISWLFSRLIENSQANYSIYEYACVDEMLISFRGRCRYKVYMPKKPAKYGLKILALTDAKTHYFLNGYIYTGKNCDGEGLAQDEKKLLVPTQSVLRLIRPIENTNRNITADNWFSSIELVRELRKKNLTYVGTLRRNKPEIPPQFLANNTRDVASSVYGFTNDLTLVSYVPKKRKAVILVSSMHHSASTDEETHKPTIIAFYNSTKGGVDALDQKCASYNTGRRTKRWPTVIFYALLNIAAVNAFVIHYSVPNCQKTTRFQFLKSLARSLVEPHMKRRLQNQVLPRQLRSLIAKLLGETMPTQQVHVGDKRKRCGLCPRERDRKTKFQCRRCQVFYCLDCRADLCLECGQD